MKSSFASIVRKSVHTVARKALSTLPRDWRFSLYRRFVDCDPLPDADLELKIADTQDELEACFRILHDAYVAAGFMKPDPSGLRVTIYHALPTTTTLCAKYQGRVVGTISIIREGVFGFPLQSVFDLGPVRARRGQVAEISALAIDPAFRRTGGAILFPLMKFMYEYCREYFDTRHILIAVNPNKIEMYESLLMFERLASRVVENYDFANGAPAVGATLDLQLAQERFRTLYDAQPQRKNLYDYFVRNRMPNIRWPQRRYFTTNDPVMTPQLMDYFFNQRTQVLSTLDERKRLLLRSIYSDQAYAAVLPPAQQAARSGAALRRHERFSIRCPAQLQLASYGTVLKVPLEVVEVSEGGFQAECAVPLPEGVQGQVLVDLGAFDHARVEAVAVRRQVRGDVASYGFRVITSDACWRQSVQALQNGRTHGDLAPPPAPSTVPTVGAAPLRRPVPVQAPRPRAAVSTAALACAEVAADLA